MKGTVDGAWCYGYSYDGCFPGSEQNLIIGVNLHGTWPYQGRTVRIEGGFTTTGYGTGSDTYGLQMFWPQIFDARTRERILIGECMGTATIRAMIAIDAECSYYTPDWQPIGVTGDIHVRALDERRVNDPVNTAWELALGPPCSSMPCAAQLQGIYY